MKIAIVVPGRFHAFDLARALRARNQEAVLFTNYPAWAVQRFGIDPAWVRGFILHGLASRLAGRLTGKLGLPYPEPVFQPWFGRWARRALARERWDIVHVWSSVAEEVLQGMAAGEIRGVSVLMRGSAHIRTQARILEEEERRTGKRIERPGKWVIEREEREYQLAQRILTLSSFSRNSFIEEGIPADKLEELPLGADLSVFRPGPGVVEDRARRIRAGEPLRVIYVGALSFQKGFWDLATVVRALEGGPFRFRAVGPVPHEASGFLSELGPRLEVVPKRPQHELPDWYRWADLFLFPTLHDGYAMVLAQAQAAGLPVLTTMNCAGPDLVEEGKTGWLVPIRDPYAIVRRLRWCHGHRQELAELAEFVGRTHRPRNWSDVARDFEALSARLVQVSA